MKERILEFLKKENKTSSQFADEIGVQPSSISHILSGRNKPSLDFIMKMLLKYPDLSTDWLIFGKDEMYRLSENLSDRPGEEDQIDSLFGDPKKVIDIQVVNDSDSPLEADIPADKPDPGYEAKTGLKKVILLYNDNSFQEYNNI